MVKDKKNAIDLFAGCGGLSQGMLDAGFNVKLSVEIDSIASEAYRMNHPKTELLQEDIREIKTSDVKKMFGEDPIHLLAGCPPCQGFSSVRRLNKKEAVYDDRNNLILEYYRMIKELRPYTIMMENVPGLKDYDLFKKTVKNLKELGYYIDYKVINVKDYNVPQNRRRLVLVGSRLGEIKVADGTDDKVTVRDTIGNLENKKLLSDELHKISANHTEKVLEMIKLTPKNGGSRKDLPEKYKLKCHKKKNVGFNDIYGRLRWDDYSTTITGGCLNPSKGRFLHPEEDRVISPREAALLQSFPIDYKFPVNIPKQSLALMIGNALPPKFSYYQSENIRKHLEQYLG